MGWFLRKLGGAMIVGIGWKLGADAYETIKDRLKKHADKMKEEEEAEIDSAGAEVTGEADAEGEPQA